MIIDFNIMRAILSMRCLICDKEIASGASIINIIFDSDLICFKCRKNLKYIPNDIIVDNYKIHSLYLYDEYFSKLLLQYKECYDEALAEVFLYPYIKKLKKKYQGFTIVLAPSSTDNLKRRGFNHLLKIFECLKLPIIDCLYKDLNINQNNLSVNERHEIIEHIKCKDVSLPNKVLLVDDVLTTGSTIKGCINCLTTKTETIEILALAYNKSYLKA